MNKLTFAVLGTAWMWVVRPVAAADEANSMLNESTYRSLVAEIKAFEVGDVLTVVVQESASAAASADLHSNRDFNASANAASNRTGAHAVSAGTGSASDGAGSTERSGKLLAQVSVRVKEVDPNGDLVVAGEQSLKINGEEQRITLTGIVRRRDIGYDNSVLSGRIANAQIRFVGAGFVNDQSKPGWLARFFNLLRW
jgi:flagellar L-ring protein FlgH